MVPVRVPRAVGHRLRHFAPNGHTRGVAGIEGADVDAAKLRAESDLFGAHLERLAELEERKRSVAPNDPAFLDLAAQVEQLAQSVLDDARKQSEIGADAHQSGVSTPIEDISPELTAYEIVDAWRAAERRLGALDPGSADAQRERALIDRYRRAYQTAFERDRRRV
jgi:hypothetical protein